ncbi:MAG TPA: hypothetical protein VKE22_16045 [Haliangiales bacterium]|nr:hypothetical protein [Haliangiales bacterium]
MPRKLSREERLQLMKFVCSFVWADLRVHEKERAFVRALVKRLALDGDEAKRVEGWLKLPPKAHEVDPNLVPPQHRKLFLQYAREAILADGEIHPEERINLALLEELLA